MSIISIRNASDVDRSLYTVSEVGRGLKGVVLAQNLGGLQTVGSGGTSTTGGRLYDSPTLGAIVIGPNPIELNDRDFAHLQFSLRDQLARLIELAKITVSDAGVLLTATQVRTYV